MSLFRRGEYEPLRSFSSPESEEDPSEPDWDLPLGSHDRHTQCLLPAIFLAYRRTVRAAKLLKRKRSGFSPRLFIFAAVGILFSLISLVFIFWPSYTHLPPHYKVLQDAVRQSTMPGRGNLQNERVFIAASLYDNNGVLAGGAWGQALLDLIDMLGYENVFLSIYENNSGYAGQQALETLAERVPCNKSIVVEEHFNFTGFPTITLPDGSERIRRVTFLAEARNRALRPLEEHPDIRYDRLLFLNDVYFDPLDAVQLLFSTNAQQHGVSNYRAACAVDFINPFKFYDTFASRDLEGYSMGLPFFPWFTTAGNAGSRKDVLDQKEAVRVRSCWGGMVAFDAGFFRSPAQTYMGRDTPVRFRAEQDLFWESSECCLIHADIQRVPALDGDDGDADTGIYMNPFIRVAYHPTSFSWLRFTRRFEKLYSIPHAIATRLVGLPTYNPRRAEIAGEEVEERVWVAEKAGFEIVKRVATNDGFCGRWDLQVLTPREENGEGGFTRVEVPA